MSDLTDKRTALHTFFLARGYDPADAAKLVQEVHPLHPPATPPAAVTPRDAARAAGANRQDDAALVRHAAQGTQAAASDYAARTRAAAAREAQYARGRAALAAIPPLGPGASERDMVARAAQVERVLAALEDES